MKYPRAVFRNITREVLEMVKIFNKLSMLYLVALFSTSSIPLSVPQSFPLADFEEEKTISAFPWPTDKDGKPSTASISIKRTTEHPRQGGWTLQIDYVFPSVSCSQVVVDIPLIVDKCYERLRFSLYGDNSGNRLEVWLSGPGGKWFGQGSFPLDFQGWKDFSIPVSQLDTDVASTLRFCIVQEGGLGKHTLFLDDIKLTSLTKPAFSDLHIFPTIPAELFQVPPASKSFKIKKEKRDDRTILLLDGEPLFCVLDVAFSKDYLMKARSAGVNCFAIDLYWFQLEPRKGYREWGRLRRMLKCLQHWGFGVILMIGPHQPNWWILQHPDEPGAFQHQAYPLSPFMKKDFGDFLSEFIKETRDFPNLVGYMVSAGGEQDTSFPEVLGSVDESAWRKSSACIADFRLFIHRKYKGKREEFRRSWEDSQIKCQTVKPPSRLANEDDYWRPWLDWCEFANSWWVRFAEWAGGIVKKLAPNKLFMVRFPWPVFQTENIFLVRDCKSVDLVQCKDAVASWEVGHPGYQRYRTALYMGACKHTDKVVFPEMDIIHDRGEHNPQFQRFIPLFADMAGALWYYRGLPSESAFEDFRQAIAKAKEAVAREYPKAKVGIFYSLAYANWISPHTNYTNENSLVGLCELLDDLGLRYAMISEFNLEDLKDYQVVIVPYNPAISEEAVRALEEFLRGGGAIIAEAEAGEFDWEKGRVRRDSGTLPFMGVSVEGRETREIEVHIKGLGLDGLRIRGQADTREHIRAEGEVIAEFADGSPAIVLGKRYKTLYIAWRFFLPYSFSDTGEQKSAKRQLILAFLRRIKMHLPADLGLSRRGTFD